MRSLVVGIVLLFGYESWAQCPTGDFSIPATACIGENLSVQNTFTGTSFEWDFCTGDLALTPTSAIAASNTLLFRTRNIRVVKSSGNWYGFTIDQASSPYRLIRFFFGTSLSNTPTVTDLGNPSSQLNGAYDFQMYLEGTDWYALVANSGGNNLLRLTFGSSLENTPTVQNLGSFGLLNTPNGITIVNDNGAIAVFVTNGGAAQIVRFDFGNSITNSPTGSSFSVTGASTLRGISITRQCDRWFGLATSYGNAKVFWLDFDAGLNQTPQSGEITFFTSYNFPASVSIIRDGGEYFAFIQSALGPLYRLSFGTSIIDKSGTGVNLGSFGVTENFATEWVKENSDWYGFSMDLGNRKLLRYTFPASCDASIAIYSGSIPPNITYTTSGAKIVALEASDAGGAMSMTSKSVVVSATTAPDIDFSTDGKICANHDVVFTANNVSGNINTYNWSFGAATSPATHQFPSAGDFDVSLQVSASNGCQNYVEKTIAIYNEPSPDFSLPPNNPLCSNQEYVFDNTSTVDASAPVTWQWQVNSVNESTTEDLTFTFPNAMSQDVKLIAAIPGCQNEKTLTVNSLIDGPIVDFSFLGSCQQDQVVFTNNSIGNIIGFDWDFDDGQTANNTDAVNSYSNAGNYDVKLTAYGQSGCNNSTTKPVTIHSKPQVNFYASPPPFSCSGTATVLNDITPNPNDSNLSTWQWDFGDAGSGQNTSNTRNPQHTYNTAGVYDVTLTVSTNFLCSATAELPITISQTPIADFTVTHLCEDLPSNFTDNSVGTITGWNWQMGSSFYSGSNTAVHTFANSGNANASLTVTASNGCIASVTKPLVVPVKPIPDFSVFKNCTNQQTLFTDITNSPPDPIASRSWNFGGLGNSFESPTTFTFNNTGNVNVTLNVLTQSGCGYSKTKAVSIVGSPTASFTATPNIGAPPLEVQFTNASINATNYLWEFNDENNSSDTDPSPSFTYPTLGQYEAQLTAVNALNCSHTVSQQINVLIPLLSVALNGLELMEVQSGQFKPAVTIFNNGNTPLSDVQLLLNINGPVVRERVDAVISPHASYRHMLQFEIPQNYLDYFCIEVEVDDDDERDNLACLSLDRSFTVFEPHPNPARGQLNVSWILENDGMVTVELLNSIGQRVTDFQVDAQEGLTPLSINTMGMSAGVYILKLHYRDTSKVYRVLISE